LVVWTTKLKWLLEKEKREQAPALQTQILTALSILQTNEKIQ